MQAIICKDAYDPDCKDLTDTLNTHKIRYVFINSLMDLKKGIKQLDQNDPFLLYRNSLMRISHPDKILRWHKENPNFDFVAVKCDQFDKLRSINVSYYPKEVELFRDTAITKKSLVDIPTWPFALDSYNEEPVRVTFKKPNCSPPAICVIAHNRATYLQLSLNSLLYSIDDTVPVYIFLNGYNSETCRVANSFREYPNVDIIQIKQNVYFAAINIALQWSKAEAFMVWEDDFILPPTARDLFPHWPYQFVNRLNSFDLVGWSFITENIPEWHRRLGNTFPRNDYAYYEWVNVERTEERWRESIDNPPLLGQAIAMTKDFWQRCSKRMPWYTPLDTEWHAGATRYCIPGLRGYHIGWNQEMDNLTKGRQPPKDPPLENSVISLKTHEHKIIKLDADF